MNARGYRQAYDKPYVLEIQRQRAERRGRPPLPTHEREQARRDHVMALAQERKKPAAYPRRAPVAPRLPFFQVVHQVITGIPAPVRGSIALMMAYAPRGLAVGS